MSGERKLVLGFKIGKIPFSLPEFRYMKEGYRLQSLLFHDLSLRILI